MSEPAEVELLTMPAEFRGRPYSARYDAQMWAESALPYADLVSTLGEATAEQTLVQAAAHYLATSAAGSGESPGLRMSHSPTNWAGSSYGDQVAIALAKLPRDSGRSRQFPFAVT